MSEGKIIVVTGGPGLGKSTLVKKLADYYKGKAFLEGEEKDFPRRIIDDIAKNERLLELVLWFRNKNVADYQEAMNIKDQGGLAFLDTYWLTNDVYVDEWLTDKFENELMRKVSEIDQRILPPPDLIISLIADIEVIKNFLKIRNRSFEKEKETIDRYVTMTAAHDKFFKQKKLENIEFIDRTNLDFDKDDDFRLIINMINNRLKIRSVSGVKN